MLQLNKNVMNLMLKEHIRQLTGQTSDKTNISATDAKPSDKPENTHRYLMDF